MSHHSPSLSGEAICYRPLDPEDHSLVQALWAQCEDVQPRLLAEPAAMARYLQRNPGCSWGAFAQGEVDALIGCVFAGHDGLRGSLHHLAVAPQARRQGIAQALVTASLQALAAVDITMTTVWIYDPKKRNCGAFSALLRPSMSGYASSSDALKLHHTCAF